MSILFFILFNMLLNLCTYALYESERIDMRDYAAIIKNFIDDDLSRFNLKDNMLMGWVVDFLGQLSEEIKACNPSKNRIYDNLQIFEIVYVLRYKWARSEIEKNTMDDESLRSQLDEFDEFNLNVQDFISKNTDEKSWERIIDYYPLVVNEEVINEFFLPPKFEKRLLNCVKAIPEVVDALALGLDKEDF